MAKKLTTEEFIKRAKAVHGDKYGYDEVVYVNAKTKVSITCLVHGTFYQTANSHINKGSGCRKCTSVKTTRETFVEQATKAHGGKYGYSNVVYVDTRTKVNVTCFTHSDFKVSPHNHINNYSGCPVCAGTAVLTTEKFVEKAQVVHGTKYNYKEVEYVNNRTKCNILCTEHGVFAQKPNQHLLGQGCPKCANVRSAEALTMSTEEFIEQAKAVHRDKFSYANSKYVNNSTKIEVICEKHGSFFPTPNNHITKMSGCPKCSAVISKGHAEVGAFLESIIND